MDNKLVGNENDIIFYTDEDGNTKIQVILQNEDVWLNTQAIANLFDVQRPAITKHINNIYLEQELEEKSTCSKMEHVLSLSISPLLYMLIKCFVIADRCVPNSIAI